MIKKNKKFIDPRYFMNEKKKEVKNLQEGTVPGGFGSTMVTHDDYEVSDEPARAETGEPPLTRKGSAKLTMDWMQARLNDSILFLRGVGSQEGMDASQAARAEALANELDAVAYDLEAFVGDYFVAGE
jgi:hypothetical protein